MPPVEATETSWLGLSAMHYAGEIDELLACLPQFAKIPCLFDHFENPYSDLIVRLPPMQSEPVVPVAMVSKGYALIQHHEAIYAIREALRAHKIEIDPYRTELTLSHFGERMHLCMLSHTHQLTIGPDDKLTVQVHCLNSMDGDLALHVRLGWYRFVCMNGMFFGTDLARFTRRHVGRYWRRDLDDMLAVQLDDLDHEKQTLQNWAMTQVSEETLLKWVDGAVAEQWGVRTAARVWSISRTGYDGVARVESQKVPAHAYSVSQESKVSGTTPPANTLYALSQVLSWVATHDAAAHVQVSRMGQVRKLIERLRKEMG